MVRAFDLREQSDQNETGSSISLDNMVEAYLGEANEPR